MNLKLLIGRYFRKKYNLNTIKFKPKKAEYLKEYNCGQLIKINDFNSIIFIKMNNYKINL